MVLPHGKGWSLDSRELMMDRNNVCWRAALTALLLIVAVDVRIVACQDVPASGNGQYTLAPLPDMSDPPDANQVELGKLLFFDSRLSGDATVACATCHRPDRAWCDGLPLAGGYPGSLNFRNAPSLINIANEKHAYWDGRLPASDLATIVRDHISEAHFMQADGRLVIERLRQTPVYAGQFQQAFGGEPTYGRILTAVSAFLSTLRSTDVPLDRFLRGDEDAITDGSKRGLELFTGKGGCIQCHHGPMLTDGQFHNVGVPPNDEIFKEPLRHITFRRFFRTLGVSEFEHLRRDVGLYAVTKQTEDAGLFRTPSLREVDRTAPYMHNGTLTTLEDVVAFYNRGGGDDKDKDPSLKPLGLTREEQADLVAFLQTLSGAVEEFQTPAMPPYGLRPMEVVK